MGSSPGALARFLKTASNIEADELAAVLLSFLFAFTLMTAYYILKPLRDALSSDWSDAVLSTLWTLTFVFSTIVVSAYGAACSRVRVGRLLPGVYAFFVLSFVAFYALIRFAPGATWINEAFYVWISVFSLFQISVFWTFMADVYSKEQALRLFGFIAAGSSIGAIVGPLLPMLLIDRIGLHNLLLTAAVLLLVPVFIIRVLEPMRHRGPKPGESAPAYAQAIGGNPFAGFTLLLRSPYLLGIALFILLYTAISTFVYFELKNLLAVYDLAARVRVWSGMEIAVNVLSIGTGLFVTGRVASRFGLTVTLAMVPVVIVAGLLIVAMAPMVWVVVGLQIVRRAGNYSITRPGREMLYTHVDRETRFKAKSVIDVVVYRGGDTVMAWGFTGLTQGLGLGLGAVAGVGAGIAALWAVVAAFLGRAFHRHRMQQDSKGQQ